nr:trypsin-like peptidase domain-containing protein [uncultured Dyadobacter sp.]
MRKYYYSSTKWFYLSFLLLNLSLIHYADAQIITRVIQPNLATKLGVKELSAIDALPTHRLPNIDVKAELKQDSLERLQGLPVRFGKSFKVNADVLGQGKQFRSADSIVTNFVVASQGARTINLLFDRFKLSAGAKLLIYTVDKRVVYGPVTAENNPENGVFWTDLLPGSGVVIQLIEPGNSLEKSQLHIANAVYGYNTAYAGYGESAACNRDIACAEGSNWRDEGNSVALMITGAGQRFCTGALVNNTCQNLTPYFLTAFHCLDGNQDGNLDGGDQASVANWVYRFRYDSPSCGGPDATSWITYNGSTFRAGFQNSDFALVELQNRPQPADGVTYSGWSRSTTAATSAVAIHHPNGDVKKISVDNNGLTNVAIATVWLRDIFGNPVITLPANTHWEANFNTGTVQPGSSGSPIYNQNSRIVGQLHGDHLNTNNDFCGNHRGQYGRFDVSWAGGGANNNRLSNWLDPANTGATDLGPISPLPSVSGPAILCTTGSYVLNNVPAGAAVTWSVSPTGSVSPSSGTGSVANLTSLGVEDVTITFRVGCNPTGGITHRIFVGPPQFGGFLVNGNPTSNGTACVNSYTPIAAVPNDPSSTYYWSQSDPNAFIANAGSSSTAFTAYNANCYYLNLNIWNTCGSTNQTLTICTNNCFARYTVFPNPAKDFVTIDFDQIESAESLPDQIALYSEKSGKLIKTVDVQDVYRRNALTNGRQIQIDAKSLPRGTYYIHVKNSRQKEKVDAIRILLE